MTGICFGILESQMKTMEISRFFTDLVGGMICALVPFLLIRRLGISADFDLVFISSIMPMVPGVAITNAIRETLNGEFVEILQIAGAISIAMLIVYSMTLLSRKIKLRLTE